MFTKRQEAELITSIQGRAEIPLKFSYLGSGADKWQKVASKRASGGIRGVETELLNKRVKDFLESFDNKKKINIIDLGCGDGTPVLPIMAELKKQNISFRYVPLDISEEMFKLAKKTIRKNYPKCEIKEFLIDFELGNFSDITYSLKSDGSSNLLVFFGNTVGNFSDRNRVLTNIRDSMGSDDFLIVGVEMTNFSKMTKVIPHYTVKEVKNLLFTIPTEIGIKKEKTKYEVDWNDKESQIECWMVLNKDQKINIGNDSFILENNEKVLLARSVKFNEWTFTKLMSDVGFRTELLTTTKNRGYVLSMVQPTRYNI